VIHPVREVHHAKGRLHVFAALRAAQARELQGQLHVLEGREHRDQVVELEDEPHVGGPPAGQLRLVEGRDVDAADDDRAAVDLVDPGDEIEQRALARARGAHQREELAFADVEVDVPQNGNDVAAALVGLADVSHLDDDRLLLQHRGRPVFVAWGGCLIGHGPPYIETLRG